MSIKEHFLEWIIRPEHYYIQKYLRYLRKEEYYTLVQPCRLFAFYYKAKKNRLGSRLGFIISAGCFDEGLKLEHYGSVIVNPKAKIGKTASYMGTAALAVMVDIRMTPPLSAIMLTLDKMLKYSGASVLPMGSRSVRVQ